MPGILDNINCDCLEGDRRNSIAAAVAGFLFFTGWWIIIDVAADTSLQKDFENSYYTCGVLGTIALFMINAVSNGQLRGDAFTNGCMGPRGARMWLFIGFVLGFGSVIAAGWILFQGYVISNATHGPDAHKWPGVAVFLQNFFIFGSSLVYKFGRSEDLWG